MNQILTSNAKFSLEYFKSFIILAKNKGYKFYTVKEFLAAGCPNKLAFVLKHDIDTRPATLPQLLDVERECGIRSTLYVRVCANDYNVMSYPVMKTLSAAMSDGFEIGLHTNFFEYATINNLDPLKVLIAEVNLLRSFFNICGMSTHRDFNYAYNALPYVEENWQLIQQLTGLTYQAYDPSLMNNTIYVNEGMKPHLCWRDWTPEMAIETGKSIYMLTHNHWWYKDHPFENI
jgi:hypothetical protein